MKHRRLAGLLALFCLLVLSAALRTEAADRYETKYNYKSKSVTVKDTTTGKTAAVLKVPGSDVNPALTVSGNDIWFTAFTGNTPGKTVNTLYRHRIAENQTESVKQLPSGYYMYDVALLWDGSLYLCGWNPSDNCRTYRYTIASGSLNKIADAYVSGRVKDDIVLDPTWVYGSWNTFPVYIYHSKKAETVRLTKKAGFSRIVGGKLYYAVVKNKGYRAPEKGLKYTIYRYTFSSGKTKKLKSTLKAYQIGKITDKYVYHVKYAYPKITYYRTKISNGKSKKISSSAYQKAIK